MATAPAPTLQPPDLPPELVRIVVALARQAADEDYRRAKAEASAEQESER